MGLRNILLILFTILSGSCAAPLEEITPPANGSFYSYDGVRIHFEDMGSGRPLVFIHGFAASIDSWRFLVEPFKKDYRLVLLDLKGHGYSDRPADARYSPRDHADVVIGLIKSLQLSHVILVGHSFGSAVALLAALEAHHSEPDLVSGVILFAGSVDPYHLPFLLRALRVPVIGWLGMKLTSASFRTRMALKKAYYDDSKITDSLVEMYAKYQHIPGTDHALLETAKAFVPPNLFELKQQLKDLNIPVVNIHGEQDKVISRKSPEEVCMLISRCRFVTVEGAGHIPQEERPDEIVPLFGAMVRGMPDK